MDFAAIDFETANEQPSSVCSVGVVIVRGGEVVDSFYSLIHPEPEYYQWFCQQIVFLMVLAIRLTNWIHLRKCLVLLVAAMRNAKLSRLPAT